MRCLPRDWHEPCVPHARHAWQSCVRFVGRCHSPVGVHAARIRVIPVLNPLGDVEAVPGFEFQPSTGVRPVDRDPQSALADVPAQVATVGAPRRELAVA